MVQLHIGGQIGCCAVQVQLAGLITVTQTSGYGLWLVLQYGLADWADGHGTDWADGHGTAPESTSVVGWLYCWCYGCFYGLVIRCWLVFAEFHEGFGARLRLLLKGHRRLLLCHQLCNSCKRIPRSLHVSRCL